MKRVSFFRAGLVGACAIIGCGPSAAVAATNAPDDDRTGSIAAPELRDFSSSHVYCFVGLTGDHSNLHRGWVCIQESTAASS